MAFPAASYSSPLPPSSPPPRSSSPGVGNISSEGGAVTDKEARLLRQLHAAQAELKKLNSKRKRSQPERSIRQLGRGIAKVVDLWTNEVTELVIMADSYEDLISDDCIEYIPGPRLVHETDEDYMKRIKQERAAHQKLKRAHKAVEVLPLIIPNFKQALQTTSPTELALFYSELKYGAGDGRADDTNKLRTYTAFWINAFDPPLEKEFQLRTETRENRGLQHEVCGKLLSSIYNDWSDPNVRAKVRAYEDGYELNANARALYAKFDGNPNDFERGFLKSRLLVKTFQFIFTSPSSANEGDPQAPYSDDENAPPAAYQRTSSKSRSVRKKTVAESLNMSSRVTPCSIAYAAVQLLFNLSNATSWCSKQQGLDFSEVYYFIVDYFDEADDDESKKITRDLLNWWNEKVFPDSRPSCTNQGAVSAREAMEALRIARKAASLASNNPVP